MNETDATDAARLVAWGQEMRAVHRRLVDALDALGLDGKWTIHPAQIEVVNAIFTPTQEQFDHAEGMLAAYEAAADHGGSGAAIYDGEMIDEANRKMAERIAFAGRAAGYER